MNEIVKALYARKSVRVFTEEEISKEDKETTGSFRRLPASLYDT